MKKLKEVAHAFLKLKSIAVVGISSKEDAAANIIYKKLRDQKYKVFAVNPNADVVEGDICYPQLQDIPEKIDGVVIGTHPDITLQIIDECAELGIRYVWIHRSFGWGSFHPDAEEKANEHGLSLIPGGCPMMFSEPVDPAHKCFRWFLRMSGKETKPIGFYNLYCLAARLWSNT